MKACKVCGTPLERKPGEHAGNWRRRVTCSPECHVTASNRMREAKRTVTPAHAPCRVCRKPITRRPDEKLHRYRERTTCSDECRWALMARTRRERGLGGSQPRAGLPPDELRRRDNERKRAWRERQRTNSIAPAGHKWSGEFPTPAGIKSTWASVTGPALAPVIATRGAPSTPPADLPTALRAHPDLVLALAGELTDSWIPYSRTHSLKGAADATP
jgi:hypothetical protein